MNILQEKIKDFTVENGKNGEKITVYNLNNIDFEKNNFNNNCFNGTVNDALDLCDKEYYCIEKWHKMGDTNTAAKKQKVDYLVKMLLSMPLEFRFADVSWCNDCGTFRRGDWKFFNAGDVAEIILRYHARKEKPTIIGKAIGDFDLHKEIFFYDCKASLSKTSRNTAFDECQVQWNGKKYGVCVLLVNQSGVFTIPKAVRDITRQSDEKKEQSCIFKHNKEYGTHCTTLEKKLGLFD